MKEKYYHYEDKYGTKAVTVCLLHDPETHQTARGLSILSPLDVLNDVEGKMYAKRNAERAIKSRRCDKITRKEAIRTMIMCKCPFKMKGEKNPELSFFEEKLLFNGSKPTANYITYNMGMNASDHVNVMKSILGMEI